MTTSLGKSIRDSGAAILLLVVGAVATGAAAQDVFVCQNGGRTFVGAGGADAPGCREVADPEGELLLSPAQPDPAAMIRELSALSARIDRLEQALFGARVRTQPRSPLARPSPDRFDTQDRMRDLGQDLERRLDELGR